MKQCDTCYYCKMTNGKCSKNNNQDKKVCKDYLQSSVKTEFHGRKEQ